MPIQEKKAALRDSLASRRRGLPPRQCLEWSDLIQSRAMAWPAYVAARAVALYSSVQNEAGTDEIAKNALASGRKVFYPRTGEGGSGELVRVSSMGDLRPGRYGVLEPGAGERLDAGHAGDVVAFVPGVAFDAAGRRLGRGSGWYDRLLVALGGQATVAGLAYDFQVVEEVPVQDWDRRVDFVITESRVIDCAAVTPSMRRSVASSCKEKGVF